MLSLYFGIKKFMISSITVETRIKIEKQVLRFAESMLLTGAIPTDSWTKIEQSVWKAGNHLTIRHSQYFFFQFRVILIAYQIKTNHKATSISHSSNYQFLALLNQQNVLRDELIMQRNRHVYQVVSVCMQCIEQNNAKTEQGRESLQHTCWRKRFLFINSKLFSLLIYLQW